VMLVLKTNLHCSEYFTFPHNKATENKTSMTFKQPPGSKPYYL